MENNTDMPMGLAFRLSMNEKAVMNFHEEIKKGVSARVILEGALELMEEEMNHPETP